jgi:hypothetical protein
VDDPLNREGVALGRAFLLSILSPRPLSRARWLAPDSPSEHTHPLIVVATIPHPAYAR